MCEPGSKYDGQKPRWDLVQFDVLEDFVKVLTFGAEKYAPDNWKLVKPLRARYLAAAFRHLVAYANGELTDPESGLPHLAHAECCLHFLGWNDKHGKEVSHVEANRQVEKQKAFDDDLVRGHGLVPGVDRFED